MKRGLYTFLNCALVLALGCQKGPYPYITKQQALKLAASAEPTIANVAFIYKQNIYYVADFTRPPKQITTDGSAAKFVKLSHDHSKFAYLNTSNILTVIDSTGKVITSLPQYTGVKSFDWSADDKTLYILNNSSMAYYGPAMNLPAFVYPGLPGENLSQEVISASVSTQGDLAYVTHVFDFSYGDEYELSMIPAGKTTPITYSDPTSGEMDYVSFSTNAQDLVVGYTDPDFPSDFQAQLDIFTALATSPAFSIGGGCTPVCKTSINLMVGGFADTNNNNLTEPAAIYTGPPQTEVIIGANYEHSVFLTNYPISGDILYTDWK